MKIKFLQINIWIKYVYLAILILNILAIFFIWQFFNNNVLKIVFFDESLLPEKTNLGSNINMTKFNELLSSYNTKKARQNNEPIRDIFSKKLIIDTPDEIE